MAYDPNAPQHPAWNWGAIGGFAALAANMIRNARATRAPVPIAAAVGATFMLARQIDLVVQNNGGYAPALANVAQSLNVDADRLAQVSFQS
jgi:hypothetical protein